MRLWGSFSFISFASRPPPSSLCVLFPSASALPPGGGSGSGHTWESLPTNQAISTGPRGSGVWPAPGTGELNTKHSSKGDAWHLSSTGDSAGPTSTRVLLKPTPERDTEILVSCVHSRPFKDPGGSAGSGVASKNQTHNCHVMPGTPLLGIGPEKPRNGR